MSSSVVGRSDGPKPLLASCVPACQYYTVTGLTLSHDSHCHMSQLSHDSHCHMSHNCHMTHTVTWLTTVTCHTTVTWLTLSHDCHYDWHYGHMTLRSHDWHYCDTTVTWLSHYGHMTVTLLPYCTVIQSHMTVTLSSTWQTHHNCSFILLPLYIRSLSL